MRFVHSFWNRCDTLSKTIEETYLWCAALSVEMIHKNGYEIDLYCDKGSYKDLSLIPYDHIYIIEIPKGVSPLFFAYCKFVALERMKLGDVHIDMDVFLRDGDLCRKVAEFKEDMIVQNVDKEEISRNGPNRESRSYLKNIKQKYGITIGTDRTMNTGVVGIRNQKLKDMYLDQYKDMVEKASPLYPFHHIIPDLVLEQDNLYILSQLYEFTYDTVFQLRGEELFDNQGVPKYEHLISTGKHERKEDIKEEVRRRNERLWKKINNRIRYGC